MALKKGERKDDKKGTKGSAATGAVASKPHRGAGPAGGPAAPASPSAVSVATAVSKRGGGRAVDDNGPAKRIRMVGLCTCSGCGGKSTDVEWATTVVNKKTGAKEATDDKCKKCWSRFKDGGFQAYQSWPEYCSHIQTSEGRRDADEADASMAANPVLSKAFASDDVATLNGIGYTIGKQFMILSESEFRIAIGKPSKQMPALPTIDIINEEGQEEKVYVFKDPKQPYRSLSMQAVMSLGRHTFAQRATMQTHAMQGAKTFGRAVTQYRDESVLIGNSALCNFDEYLERFAKYDRARLSKNAQRRVAATDGEVVANEEGDADSQYGEVERDGQVLPPAASSPVQQATPSIVPATKATGASTPSAEGAPASAQNTTRLGRASSVGNLDDVASVCGSVSTAGGRRDPGSSKKDQHYYHHKSVDDFIGDLDLFEIMSGSKYKVQLHHATNSMKRMQKDSIDYARLSTHLELVEKASKLADISEVPESARAALLHDVVVSRKMDVPATLQEQLVIAAMREGARNLASEGDIERLMNMLLPATAMPADFDVLKPKLADSILPTATKATLFQTVLMNDVLLPLVRKGTLASQALDIVCDVFLRGIDTFLAEALEDADGANQFLGSLFEVVPLLRALRSVIAVDLRRRVIALSDLRMVYESRGSTARKLPVTLANELGKVEWYWTRVQELVQNEAVCVDAANDMEKHMEALQSLPDKLCEAAACLADICGDISRWMAAVPAGSIDDFNQAVHAAIGKILQLVPVAATDSSTDITVLNALQKNLAEMNIAFPMDTNISGAINSIAETIRSRNYNKLINTVRDKCPGLLAALRATSTVEESGLAQHIKTTHSTVTGMRTALDSASGSQFDGDMVGIAEGVQKDIVQWLWANWHHGPDITTDLLDVFGKLGKMMPPSANMPAGGAQLIALMNCEHAMTKCGSAEKVLQRLGNGFQDDAFQEMRSALQALRDTKLDDGCVLRVVDGIIKDGTAVVEQVANTKLTDKENTLASNLDELEAMIDKMQLETGEPWDHGIAELKWKAAAGLISKRLETGDADPKVLENKVHMCKDIMMNYKEQVAAFAATRSAEADLTARCDDLCKEAIRITLSGALASILLEPPKDKVVLFRSIKKLVKRVKDDRIGGIHGDLLAQATKMASVK